MPIVDRPEVTCYRIWLQVDKTLNIRRWSSEVICALKKSSYLSRAITATIIGRYLFLYSGCCEKSFLFHISSFEDSVFRARRKEIRGDKDRLFLSIEEVCQ